MRLSRDVKGVRLHQVWDMSGNVWAWTNSKDKDEYVLRDGSWEEEAEFVQVMASDQ